MSTQRPRRSSPARPPVRSRAAGPQPRPRQVRPFDSFAGLGAIIAGVAGIVYSFAFVVLVVGGKAPALGVPLSSAALMIGGVLSTAALVALYNRLRDQDVPMALWALLLSIVAALGSVTHGGWDLANALNPPAALPAPDVPSQIDPRGLLTFGLAGIGLFGSGTLIARDRRFPRGFAGLTYLSAALLVIVYLVRLIVLTPTSPAVILPAAILGFGVNPAWYIWLGLQLRKG